MVLGHRRHSAASNRSSVDDSRDYSTEDETVVDPDQGNVLMHIISQLRPGADLSRVTLPTFILEPRSMLERITNFMAHPECLTSMPTLEDPTQRFISVVRSCLSGWHIKPPGVKKPLNPILGETFTCYWEYPQNARGYYIAEQTSHHPPKSSYFFMAPELNVRIDGTLKPRSKFLGNSAASLMEGIAVMTLLDRNERYFITQPNMYARGILFGKMKFELGDHMFVRCPDLDMHADIEFKTKGYFGGTYNALGGFIKETSTDKNLYELSGHWNTEIFIKNLTTGQKELLFNAKTSKPTPLKTRPLEEQDERESQKLWHATTAALINKDQELATTEKSKIEDMQRQEAGVRGDEGVDWRPRLFRAVNGGPGGSEEGLEDLDWIINAKIDGKTAEELTKQILQIAAILPGQSPPERFAIPSRKASLQERPNNQEQTTAQPDRTNESHPAPAAPAQASQVAKAPQQAQQETPVQVPQTTNRDSKHDSGTEAVTAGLKNVDINSSRRLEPEHIPVRRMDSQTSEIDEFHDAEQ